MAWSSNREDPDVDEQALFGALEDDTTRAILAHTSEQARSATELEELIDVTKPTIYRRLEQLTEEGLLHESVELDRSGNHYNRYRATISGVDVSIRDERVRTRVERREEVAERFTRIWAEIRGDQ